MKEIMKAKYIKPTASVFGMNVPLSLLSESFSGTGTVDDYIDGGEVDAEDLGGGYTPAN